MDEIVSQRNILPDLSGKTALITGTTSGFGWRFAQLLSAAGAAVVLTGRRRDRLDALDRAITEQGGRAAAFTLDITDADNIVSVIEAAEGTLGPVDILVNNAGMNVEGRAVDLAPEDFDRIMDTNVRGAFLMAREVAKRMIARGAAEGRIINIASIGGLKVLPGLAAYCMSKAAIVMMTKSLAREWARHGINVNAICPGYIETEINRDWFASEGGRKQIAGFPRRRLGEIEDLDGALMLLAGPQSRFMTGSILTVDDGQTLA